MKKRRLLTLVGSICLVLVLAASALMAACAPAPEAPLTPAEFYAQNEATLVTNYSVGGSTDFATRIIASHWGRFVEGGRMVVKNISGGGGIPGVNYLWDAKPDGLTLLLTCPHSALVPVHIFGAEAAKYNIGEFIYLVDFGRTELGFQVGVHTPYESIEDVKGATGFKIAASGPQAQAAIGGALLIEALGLKDTKWVFGYPGSAEIGLSLQRGETDGTTYSVKTAVSWMEKGICKEPLVMLNDERSEWFPDVPALPEVVTLSPDGQMLFNVMMGMQSTRTILLPPGVSQDRVDFLEDIFWEMVNDEGVIEQLQLEWKIWSEPRTAEEFTAFIASIEGISPEDLTRLRELLQEYAR